MNIYKSNINNNINFIKNTNKCKNYINNKIECVKNMKKMQKLHKE
jgi:hypothetical protein